MAKQRGGIEKGSAPTRVGLVPFVAVHVDVQIALREWQASQGHEAVAQKVKNLIEALTRGERSTVDAILRRLAVDPIHNCSGLVEVGPKQSRGGAARVFLLQEFSAAFFVAAGVEKGNKGVKIDEARKRANHLKEVFRANIRAEAMKAISRPAGPYALISAEAKP